MIGIRAGSRESDWNVERKGTLKHIDGVPVSGKKKTKKKWNGIRIISKLVT